MQTPIRILFLCTGNSCRSIIAEALANQLGGGRLKAFSAGSFPSGKVNDDALSVLARHDITVIDPSSQSWSEYEHVEIDLVITVCDAAANESCPVWLGRAANGDAGRDGTDREQTAKAHWGVADPAYVSGSAAEIEAAFELTYEQMKRRIEALLQQPLESIDAQVLQRAAAEIQRECSAAEVV